MNPDGTKNLNTNSSSDLWFAEVDKGWVTTKESATGLSKQPGPPKRKVIAPPKTITPKIKEQKQVHRAPGAPSPGVSRPFTTGNMTGWISASVDEEDFSVPTLRAIDAKHGITNILWSDGGHGGEGETGRMSRENSGIGRCRGLNGDSWSNLDEFLRSREYLKDDEGGIWGMSHPNCNCTLKVTLADSGDIIEVDYMSSSDEYTEE